VRAGLETRLARIEAGAPVSGPPQPIRRYILDSETLVDSATGQEPDPETKRRIIAGEQNPDGRPMAVLRVIVAPATTARTEKEQAAVRVNPKK
jgi:hypothetical protein